MRMFDLPAVLDLSNLVDPDQDIYDSKPQDETLEESIGNNGADLGVEIQQIVVLPGSHPGQTQQKHSDLEGGQNVNVIESFPEPANDSGECIASTLGIRIRRQRCGNSREHAFQNRP
jgi:hypothetical protein